MKTCIRFIAGGVLLLTLLFAGATRADSNPAAIGPFSSQERGLGPEYQLSVSSNPETDRYVPAAAYNTASRQTLVVWHRNGGGSYYIEGRLLDAFGKPIGSTPTVMVSGATPVYQPAVAYNAAWNQYLVVWMRNTSLDGKTYAIWGKILGANLAEVHAEFEIFTPPANYSSWTPRVAWNPVVTAFVRDYQVVFNTFNITAWPAMVPEYIAEESVDWDGSLIGHILVIGNSPGNLIYPQGVDLVFANRDGDGGKYLWVWKQVKPGTADYDIWAANIDASLGGYINTLPPWKVDDSTVEQSNPRIATNGANDFMVVWQQRDSSPPNDWDIRGREMNQIGTFIGDVHVIAGQGSTDETDPFVTGWPGSTPRYAVGYARQSETGQGIWLAYDNNGANILNIAGYNFWLDYFPAADFGFWTNSMPTGVAAGAYVQIAYQGISNTPGDHTQIYSRAWTPYLTSLPLIRR